MSQMMMMIHGSHLFWIQLRQKLFQDDFLPNLQFEGQEATTEPSVSIVRMEEEEPVENEENRDMEEIKKVISTEGEPYITDKKVSRTKSKRGRKQARMGTTPRING